VDPDFQKTDPCGEQFENVMRAIDVRSGSPAFSAYIGFGLMGAEKSGRALSIVCLRLYRAFTWIRGLLVSMGLCKYREHLFHFPQTEHNIVLALVSQLDLSPSTLVWRWRGTSIWRRSTPLKA